MQGAIPGIPKVHQLSTGNSSVFLVVEDRVTIIDAGPPGSGKRVLEYLSRLGRSPQDVSHIVSTHYHLDHFGDVAHLKESCSAQVAVHEAEVAYVQGDIPLPSRFQNRVAALLMAPIISLYQPAPFSVDLPLRDGDQLDVLGGTEIIHCPGHTPGSISLYFPGEGLLIAGDALQYSRGRLGLPARSVTLDMGQAKESIRRLAQLDFNVLCFSHFPPLVKGASKALHRLAENLD